ncbi:unnamed protein product [Candidula unifasciata]|uniref:Uncharacterized protein n=1 Tax=Candidula unifasciata TaxID=100452 RepID=A0A8S3YTB6_9EUPU|nr:unnamed protein product [Candidula unifasciata]
MLSKSLMSLLSLVVVVAVVAVSARPSPDSYDTDDWFDHQVDGRNDDYLDWLDDKYDDYYDTDSYRDQKFHLFLTITKSLRSAEFDSVSLSRLYKTFLRGVLSKRYRGGKHDYDLRHYDSDHHDDSDEWDDYFDEDDFHYRYDDDLKEEKTKKLFMYYLKFRAHYQAQKEIERIVKHKEEKARKQFALFSELVSFVEKTRVQHDIAEKFSKFVDLKLKPKFDSFKKCFYHEQCDKDDYHDFDAYRSGEFKQCFSMVGGKDYEDDGKHFELFLKLYKSVRLISHSSDSHEEDDSFPDWDFHNDHHDDDDHHYDDDDDDEWKDKHPIYRYFAYLHKHLYNNNPLDVLDKQRNYKDPSYDKFLFFAIRAYKELKDEKAMKDRQEKLEAIFAHFLRFITHQEDNVRTNSAFYKFQKWREVRDHKEKLDEFAASLRKVSQLKGSDALWAGKDDLLQKFDHFFEHKKHDYREDSYEQNYRDYPFSTYGYRKQRPYWNRKDW